MKYNFKSKGKYDFLDGEKNGWNYSGKEIKAGFKPGQSRDRSGKSNVFVMESKGMKNNKATRELGKFKRAAKKAAKENGNKTKV